MLKVAKTPGILLIFATVLVLAVVGAALLPAGTASAAPAVGVGYVDFVLLVSSHPDTAAVQRTVTAAYEQAEKDFDAKSAGMNDQDKRNLYIQIQQQVDNQTISLLDPIKAKVRAAIKEVADSKGLSLVIDKSIAIYGGVDITADVGKKISGQ